MVTVEEHGMVSSTSGIRGISITAANVTFVHEHKLRSKSRSKHRGRVPRGLAVSSWMDSNPFLRLKGRFPLGEPCCTRLATSRTLYDRNGSKREVDDRWISSATNLWRPRPLSISGCHHRQTDPRRSSLSRSRMRFFGNWITRATAQTGSRDPPARPRRT